MMDLVHTSSTVDREPDRSVFGQGPSFVAEAPKTLGSFGSTYTNPIESNGPGHDGPSAETATARDETVIALEQVSEKTNL